VIFDSDVIISAIQDKERGRRSKAREVIDGERYRFISVITMWEVLGGSRGGYVKTWKWLNQEFDVIPLKTVIMLRCHTVVESYARKHQVINAMDAIIAAMTLNEKHILCSNNVDHFKFALGDRVKSVDDVLKERRNRRKCV
jgi:predicted nucleic acid-binding protein